MITAITISEDENPEEVLRRTLKTHEEQTGEPFSEVRFVRYEGVSGRVVAIVVQ